MITLVFANIVYHVYNKMVQLSESMPFNNNNNSVYNFYKNPKQISKGLLLSQAAYSSVVASCALTTNGNKVNI